jgi:peptidoglycan hydrolase-like protein with peptidoglycan-binding domain
MQATSETASASTPEALAITCRVLLVGSPYMEGLDVFAAQQALLAAGFNPGPLDGIYGPNTANAVSQFQAARGLPITAQVCGQTYVQLGVSCASVPPCPAPPIFCRVLKVERPLMSGQDVYAVQHALVAAGFSPGPVDGVYGHRTQAAVQAFQAARGLGVTGVVCGQTYVLLNVGCSSVPACPTGIVCRVLDVCHPFLRGADVLAVQQALVTRGYSPGPLDGIYGPLTAAAVRAFQAANGLAVTGVTCGQTYVLLGVGCDTVPPCPSEPSVCRVLVTANPFKHGADVLAVQQALLAQGFSPGALDGIYGPLTATAVRNFQMSRGLLVTGVVCDGLYTTLGVTCASGPPPCPTGTPIASCRELRVTSPFTHGSDVAAVQIALAGRGFDPGVVDGIYGPNSAAAVRSFQAAAGLAVTGIVCSLEYRGLLLNCGSFPAC